MLALVSIYILTKQCTRSTNILFIRLFVQKKTLLYAHNTANDSF